MTTRLVLALDFAMRLVFFAVAPFLITMAAALFPVTGALLQVALALVVFVASESFQRFAGRHGWVARILGAHLAFDEFYRRRPPRPFLYYVFYPLLFWHWLTVREARREFLLYKGYTLASFVLLLGTLAYQYTRDFRPELGVRPFALIALGTILVEAAVVLVFLMPIATTVVHFHLQKKPWALAVLLVVGAASATLAIARLERKRDPIVSFATRERIQLRTDAKRREAYGALVRALSDTWKILPRSSDDIESDGKVLGTPLERAHDALESFYKRDEAFAFDLWFSKKKHRQLLVVYFEARRGRAPIWLGMDRAGKIVNDPKALPSGAFLAMRHAADGLQPLKW